VRLSPTGHIWLIRWNSLTWAGRFELAEWVAVMRLWIVVDPVDGSR
jgi:hypothetical protein